ncbi:tRNA (adenosine(37)-N6)-dimethylallyltransferase MiaA [Geminicoccus roseus]|uniref:tRNA (adenosine(37)-N6)-dimethylallyltransferase MiaA n=1 Tax=Geminicoccus roseus TaxID=404900 RepID=UPI0003F8064A|nr:tRNA (adenosine(37)-N6)-dimethylallyltransferase MiaA [Geminicoccus roseus]
MLHCNMNRPVIVIGGPTASGKSALAMAAASALGGIVVNADSMQLYRDLPVLTARPVPAEEAAVPHALYGIWDAAEQGSAGRWLALLEPLLKRDVPLVLVGGTGLYLDALLHGIAPVPVIRPEIREEVRALPPDDLHPLLAREDPEMAARLRPSDPQRLMRALEVVRSTGRSLSFWQDQPRVRPDLGPLAPLGIALVPPRAALVARIERRLAAMAAAGAFDELASFRARPGTERSPLLKAVGVPELARHLDGLADADTALADAAIATRRYAKRQVTFLRHRLSQLQPIAGFGDDPAVREAVLDQILAATAGIPSRSR